MRKSLAKRGRLFGSSSSRSVETRRRSARKSTVFARLAAWTRQRTNACVRGSWNLSVVERKLSRSACILISPSPGLDLEDIDFRRSWGGGLSRHQVVHSIPSSLMIVSSYRPLLLKLAMRLWKPRNSGYLPANRPLPPGTLFNYRSVVTKT